MKKENNLLKFKEFTSFVKNDKPTKRTEIGGDILKEELNPNTYTSGKKLKEKRFNEELDIFLSRKEKKENAKKDIDKCIDEFNDALDNYKIVDKWDHVSELISSYSNLADSLDKFAKYVNTNKDEYDDVDTVAHQYLEYHEQWKKISKVIFQKIRGLVVIDNIMINLRKKLSGWSIGYDPVGILKDASNRIYKHGRIISNLIYNKK